MIVNTGLLQLLTAQVTYLNSLYWGLFTNNVSITASTVWSNLTVAAWTGFAEVNALNWSTPSIVAGVAVNSGLPNPSFGNSSGSTQTFYGWYARDTSNILVACVNLTAQSLVNGGFYTITPSLSDAEA
jgi:hypothetical protein